MSGIKCSAILSKRDREATASSCFFAPQAPGSSPISGRNLFFCSLSTLSNPKFLTCLIRSYLCFPRLSSEKIYYVNQMGKGTIFSPPPTIHLHRLSWISFQALLYVFCPEVKPLSRFTFRNFRYGYFYAIMVVLALSYSPKFYGYYRQRQTTRKSGTQNYRPFKWWLSYRVYIPSFR